MDFAANSADNNKSHKIGRKHNDTHASMSRICEKRRYMYVVVLQSLRTNGNVFIVNLAIADLCVSSFVNPFSIVGEISLRSYGC